MTPDNNYPLRRYDDSANTSNVAIVLSIICILAFAVAAIAKTI